ncbi:hypothetical protein AVL61_14990 [Kocuria rosea subsp. polaris]|uniref:Uncharacterized protein n=1 Tax=Kocuria rosea subsp. polaris TaxID=136273 RepID=A0A0W8I6E7_KOCRO|nr:hypothetical protein [Kocuria polaris]KUG53840.1 hypothetical protein AVL61_14990 [Kocuria polaris]
MAGALIAVTTGVGGSAAVVAAAGLWLSVKVDQMPDPASMALLVAGVVLLAIGFVANFEHQSRLWTARMEAQLQERRRELQSLGITPGHSTQTQ